MTSPRESKKTNQHQPQGHHVLGVGGSPRKGGNSDIILGRILKGVSEHHIQTRAVHVRDYLFQGCIGCEKCRKTGMCKGLNDGMALIWHSLYPEDLLSGYHRRKG